MKKAVFFVIATYWLASCGPGKGKDGKPSSDTSAAGYEMMDTTIPDHTAVGNDSLHEEGKKYR